MRLRAGLLALAAVLAGCGGSIGGFHRPSSEQVRRLQTNSSDAVYYAGRSFGGLPLTDAVAQGRNYELLVYGTCSPGPDAGCAPPIEIEHFPFKASQWRLAVGCSRQPTLRGVPTVHHDSLVLVTGHQIVKIYARSPAENRRVAQALRRVDGKPTPQRLPQPPATIRELVERVCPSR